MIQLDDVIVYDPQGRPMSCREIITAKGGWEQITAEEATALAQLGCHPDVFSDSLLGVPQWASPIEEQGGTTDPAVVPSLGVPAEQPFWAGPEEEVTLGEFFTGSDLETNPIEYTGFQIPGFTSQGGPQPSGTIVERSIEQMQGLLAPFFQTDQIQTGITEVSRFPGRCATRRRKLKIITDPQTGTPRVVMACPPRRMNPCNAKALGRAARRLSMFQRMSAGVEKLINRQLKRKSRPSYRAPSCAPKRCR